MVRISQHFHPRADIEVEHELSSCCTWAQLLCSMWNANFPTRNRTHIPCIARQPLSHWTTSEVPGRFFFETMNCNTAFSNIHPTLQISKISLHPIEDNHVEKVPVLSPEELEAIKNPDSITNQIAVLEAQCHEMKPNLGAIADYKKKVQVNDSCVMVRKSLQSLA